MLALSMSMVSSALSMDFIQRVRQTIFNHLSARIRERFTVPRSLAAPSIIQKVPTVEGSLTEQAENIIEQCIQDLKLYNLTLKNISCLFYVTTESGQEALRKYLQTKKFEPQKLAVELQSLEDVKVALVIFIRKKEQENKKVAARL